MILSIGFYTKRKKGLEKTLMSFGERVRLIVEERGIEQKALAGDADIPVSTLNSILRGVVKSPNVRDALRIARALRVPLDELADEDGPVPQSPLTPYDTTAEYRELIDLIERVPRRDRARLLEAVTWLVSPRSEGVSTDSSRRPAEQSRESATDSEIKRLTATIERMDEEQKRRFFEELAAKDTYEILSIRDRKTPKSK